MSVSQALSVTQESQNKANNNSTIRIKWTSTQSGDSFNDYARTAYYYVSVNGGEEKKYSVTYTLPKGSTKTIVNTTLAVAHNSEGKCQVKVRTWMDTRISAGVVEMSKSLSLTDIPRASTFGDISGNTIGSDITVNINRKESSYTHQCWYKLGDSKWYDLGTGIETSITFKPDMALCSQLPTSTKGTLELCIRTFSGSTRIGSDVYKNITVYVPDSVKPTCSITVTDTLGYADIYGSYVKGKSKFSVSIAAKISYGSDITSYNTAVDGLTYTTASFETGIVNKSGTLTIKATVKDKRGRTGTATVDVNVLDYFPPMLTKLTVKRCNADGEENDQGEYTEITFSGKVASLSQKNTATYMLQYKKSKDKTYISVEITNYKDVYEVNDATYIFNTDSSSSYDIQILVSDALNGSVKGVTSVSSGFTPMNWLKNGLGMAIGKVAELTNVFDIAFQTRFLGGILYDILADNTDLDSLLTPNAYYLYSDRNYINAPESGRGMVIEIIGNGGSLLQRITINSKTSPVIYERFHYSNTWGDWLKISDFAGKTLWSGGWYMSASQTATLSEAISKQPHGVVLIFSNYADGAAKNTEFTFVFVPKIYVAKHSGCGINCICSGVWRNACKYLYIYDEKIVGNDNNSKASLTVGGITYENNACVLRYVIGV